MAAEEVSLFFRDVAGFLYVREWWHTPLHVGSTNHIKCVMNKVIQDNEVEGDETQRGFGRVGWDGKAPNTLTTSVKFSKKYILEEKKNTTKSVKLWSPLSLLSWLCGADFTGFYVGRVMVVLKLMLLFPALDKNRHSTVSGSSFCIPVAQTADHLSFPSLKVKVSFQRYN